MIAKLNEFLKQYVTAEGIPLKQVLMPEDLSQLAVSLYHLTKSKESKDFEAISNGVFKALGDKGEKAIDSTIEDIFFTYTGSKEENIANRALLGYYCFMYFRTLHDLPVEKIMSVVNHYISQHLVNNEDTSKVNCNNPISNLIPINEEQYVRFNGKTIIPPFDETKAKFIETISNLLIK